MIPLRSWRQAHQANRHYIYESAYKNRGVDDDSTNVNFTWYILNTNVNPIEMNPSRILYEDSLL